MTGSFSLASTPLLHFGAGKIDALPAAVKAFGSDILLVTGARSFRSSPAAAKIADQLTTQKINFHWTTIDGEPTPAMIDIAVKKYASQNLQAVIAIGGGSVIDAGKAIAAMLPLNESVKEYLEGVGTKSHPGTKVPFVAVPTTSGTGSEATKNAVLSEVGEQGYKKSLRHNRFVPDKAIVDPELTISCPPFVTAASGMDAFTQLLESYLSTAANPVTDALAYEGLRLVSHSLLSAYRDGTNLEARSNMSLAAYLSGITLANAGLGTVHGFASSIGGHYNISHGVICSAMMEPVNRITVRKLRAKSGYDQSLTKYANVGKLFSGITHRSDDYYIDFLLVLIDEWKTEMKIPRISSLILPADLAKIIGKTENKNNPVPLDHEDLREVLNN
jgi:alcohol dehydrogenase class IV